MELYNQSAESVTMRDYLKVLFRQKAVVITTIITVVLAVLIGLQFKTPEYEAKVKMLISAKKQVESPYYRELAGFRNVEAVLTQSEIVDSNPVIDRVVRVVALYDRPLSYEVNFSSMIKKPFITIRAKMLSKQLSSLSPEQKKVFLFRMAVEDLKKQVKVEPIRDTNLFNIIVRDYSPLGAAILANVVSRSYVIFDLEQQLAEIQLKYGEKHPMTIQLKDNIIKLTAQLNGQPLSDMEAMGPASVKIIEQAVIPLKSVGMSKLATFILAVFMSIFLGIMLAFMFDYLDQTFKSPQELESYLNLPYLGAKPKKRDNGSYHDLADQIYLIMKDKELKSVLIASASKGEGTSEIIANLGTYFSKTAGYKVLIIDANLRNPAMQHFFRITDVQGLVELLEGKASFDQAVQDLGGNLNILFAGKSAFNPVTILGSHAMQELLKQAKEKYDIILIDSAGLSGNKDGAVVASFIDGVVLVVNEGKTRKQVIKNAIAPLENKRVVILGAILNNRTFPIPEKLYRRL
ncbi:MAG: polysaccharide biosynthesis tyrosine autokinase [Candidatus Omnitrophota bacterium]